MNLRTPLTVLLAATLLICCKKDIKDETQVEPPGGGGGGTTDYTTKEIKVVLPANSTIDLASCTILSLGKETALDSKGSAKAAFVPGTASMAYIFNKSQELIMAGFLTDSTAQISAASTARILLYWG